MLVIDCHALQPINFLHFIDQMFLEFLRSANIQNLMRIDGTFGQLLAFADVIALKDDYVFADRNQMLFFRAGLLVLDHDAALATHARPEIDNAVDLRNFRSIFRTARFE